MRVRSVLRIRKAQNVVETEALNKTCEEVALEQGAAFRVQVVQHWLIISFYMLAPLALARLRGGS